MSKAIAEEVKDELRLTEQEFDWEGTGGHSLPERLTDAVNRASRRVRRKVGTSNYNSADATVYADLKDAEHAMACAIMLRERIIILSSRPEEAPPAEYIDLSILTEQVNSYLAEFNDCVNDYLVEDSVDTPGSGFAFGSYGLDESENDDHSARDLGEIGVTS